MTVLAGRWAVCRLAPHEPLPGWASAPAPLAAVVRTSRELSIVAPEELVPDGIQAERGFVVLEAAGPIPFATTGVIASIAGPLADAGISLVPLGTYDTDYVLVKGADLDRAMRALVAAGWDVRRA